MSPAAMPATPRQPAAQLGGALVVTDRIELYANWGQGFHSNDAWRDDPLTPVPGLVKAPARVVLL
jgi:hypothetical protein